MNRLVWILILLLLIGWFVGAFIMTVGRIIHLLLIAALVILVIRIISRRNLR
jgi:hypothetical protein